MNASKSHFTFLSPIWGIKIKNSINIYDVVLNWVFSAYMKCESLHPRKSKMYLSEIINNFQFFLDIKAF